MTGAGERVDQFVTEAGAGHPEGWVVAAKIDALAPGGNA